MKRAYKLRVGIGKRQSPRSLSRELAYRYFSSPFARHVHIDIRIDISREKTLLYLIMPSRLCSCLFVAAAVAYQALCCLSFAYLSLFCRCFDLTYFNLFRVKRKLKRLLRRLAAKPFRVNYFSLRFTVRGTAHICLFKSCQLFSYLVLKFYHILALFSSL